MHSTVSLLERARLTGGTPTITPDQAFDSADTASTFRGGYSTPNTTLRAPGPSSGPWSRLSTSCAAATRERSGPVKVGLPQAQAGSRVGAKPRTSRPKRSTGPAP